MGDDLSTFLSGSHHHASISPETLEVMGKQAANLFLNEKVDLNKAVVKVASAYDAISPEQVKRVVEFANVTTYLALHDKNKTSGAKVSYPQFHLADPEQVIKNMGVEARPTAPAGVATEYGLMPAKEKVSNDPREEALAELFGAGKEKKAEIDFSRDTAINEITSAKDALVALRSSLRGSAEQVDMMFKEASAELYELAKRHVLEGGSVADIVMAAETGVGKEKVSEVLQPVIVGFLREKVMGAEEMKSSLAQSLEKVAHRIVNPENRMVKAAKAVVDCSTELNTMAIGLEEVEGELEKVNNFIKSSLTSPKM